MTYKSQFAKALTLLKFGCVTLSLVGLSACESEYPQRKGVNDKKLPLTGSPTPTETPTEEPTPTETPTEIPTETPTPEETPDDGGTKPTAKPTATTKPNGEGGTDGEKLEVDQVFVCQNSALVSIENGRTNCFVRKDTKFLIAAATFLGTSFVEVTLKEKQNGCTMTKGRLFGAHISKSAECDKTLGK